MAEGLPKNVETIVWHRGTKSFAEGLKFPNGQHRNIKQLFWQEAPRGEQLPEECFASLFSAFLGIARANPKDTFQFTRYDLEAIVPENENNRPFKVNVEGGMEKTIQIFGHVFHSKL